MLTYQRYNVRFEQRYFRETLPRTLPASLADALAAQFASRWPQPNLDRLARMDKPGNMRALKELGTLVASVVQSGYFPAAFDSWLVATTLTSYLRRRRVNAKSRTR